MVKKKYQVSGVRYQFFLWYRKVYICLLTTENRLIRWQAGRKLPPKAIFLFSLWLVLLPFIPGCGYTTRSMISDKYRYIYITPFVNRIDFTQETAVANKYKIYRPMLETEITKAVIDKFIFDGNLKLKEKGAADLVLKGDLVEFRKDPLRYSENDEIDEYRLNIMVDISLWDNRENRLVWEEKRFTGDFTYFPITSTFTNVAKKSDAQAVVDAVKDLARRIVERTVEQW